MIFKKAKTFSIFFTVFSIVLLATLQFSHASILSSLIELDERIGHSADKRSSEELLTRWVQKLKDTPTQSNLESRSELVGPSILKLSFLRRTYSKVITPSIVNLFLKQVWYQSANQLLSKNTQGPVYNFVSSEDLVKMLRGLYQLDEIPELNFLKTFTNALTHERLSQMTMKERDDLRNYYVIFAKKVMDANARASTDYRIIASKAIERLIDCGADQDYSVQPKVAYNNRTRQYEKYFSKEDQARLDSFAQFQKDARNLFIQSLHDHVFLRIQPSLLFIQEFKKLFVDENQITELSPVIATQAIKDMAKLGLFNQANYGKAAFVILDKWVETAHNFGDLSHFREPKHLIEFMWALMLIDATIYQENETEIFNSKWNSTLFPFIKDGLTYLENKHLRNELTFDKGNPQDSFRSHQFFTLRNYLKKIRPYSLEESTSKRKKTYHFIPKQLRAYLKQWGNLQNKDFLDKKYNRVSEDELNETVSYTTSKTQDRIQETITNYLSKNRPDLKVSSEVWNKNKAAPIDIVIQSTGNIQTAKKLIKESQSGSDESDQEGKNSADPYAAEMDPTLMFSLLSTGPKVKTQVKPSSVMRGCAGVALEVDGPDHFILTLQSDGEYSERNRPSDILSDLFFSKASKYIVKRISYIEWDQMNKGEGPYTMREWINSLARSCSKTVK